MSTAPNPIFQANLAAIAATSPSLARSLLHTPARGDVSFVGTEDGVPSAMLGHGSAGRLLASGRRPLDEAKRIAGTVDLKEAAGVLILGFGLGYHAKALVERLPPLSRTGQELPPWGIVVIFEPDLALLRAVLERLDHSTWLRRGDVVIVTEPTQGALAIALRRREALPFLGTDVAFIEHPAQRARLGAAGGEFVASFREWIRASRTSVMTSLANGHVTTRNALMNLDRYVTVSGVSDLANAARVGAGSGGGVGGETGTRPAIVVSAGPSLARNIAQLKKPGIRERFVIIAVQTVLKTLLAEGIRPHFVTALDYHEVSRRFYEGLTAADVEGVTLIAEAKANPAIISAFPGAVRMPGDSFLEEVVGEDLSRLLGMIRPGATVSHMAYYVARLLGCDPVILVGQDLGFTDGQYYAAGAAIHQVWSGELNEFRTLEMMEWERIVRGRYNVGSGGAGPKGREAPSEPNLHKRTDVLGRTIYTDQQMSTYLAQFERDFREDEARGLRVIDATEGGVAKDHTVAMTLAEAIEQAGYVPPLELPSAVPAHDAERRVRRVGERVRKVRQDVWRIGEHSREAAKLIEEMLAHHHDQARVNRLIGRAHTLAEEVGQMRPAFGLVQFLNQAGSLKRVRADRAIMLEDMDGGLSPIERQRRELERDLVNVRWLGEAADELGTMLDGTARMLAGGERSTGEAVRRGERDVERALEAGAAARGADEGKVGERARIVAMIAVDPGVSGLGFARELGEPLAGGTAPLTAVLTRLARCREIDGVVIVCEHPDRVRGLLGSAPHSLEVEIVKSPGGVYGERSRGVAGARLWSRTAWRGGLGGLSVYDEACAPSVMSPVMESRRIDAAAVVGADWALVDPALIDEAVAKFREGAGHVRLSFCQAPPGLGCAVVERTLMRELASNETTAGALASIGGRLSYSPLFPMPDPIANLYASASGKPVCVPAAPVVRDCGLRFVADGREGSGLLGRVMAAAGEGWAGLSGAEVVRLAGEQSFLCPAPAELVIELCTGRLTSGMRGAWLRGGGEGVERPVMGTALAERILRQLGEARTDAVVTFFGAGDPMLHPDLPRLVACAKSAGVAGVHVRTDLVDTRHVEALLEGGVDVLSVDLMAETAGTYRAVMGADLFDRARANLVALIERRAATAGGGLPTPWIVPRMTRCDAVYEEVENFYDRWLLAAGACTIDAMPAPRAGERIEPLPPPAAVTRRVARSRLVVRSDGTVAGVPPAFGHGKAIGDLSRDELTKVWKKAASLPAATTQIEAMPTAAGELGGPARERETELVSPTP